MASQAVLASPSTTFQAALASRGFQFLNSLRPQAGPKERASHVDAQGTLVNRNTLTMGWPNLLESPSSPALSADDYQQHLRPGLQEHTPTVSNGGYDSMAPAADQRQHHNSRTDQQRRQKARIFMLKTGIDWTQLHDAVKDDHYVKAATAQAKRWTRSDAPHDIILRARRMRQSEDKNNRRPRKDDQEPQLALDYVYDEPITRPETNLTTNDITGKYNEDCEAKICDDDECKFQHNRSQNQLRKRKYATLSNDIALAITQSRRNKKGKIEQEEETKRAHADLKLLKSHCLTWKKKSVERDAANKKLKEEHELSTVTLQNSLRESQNTAERSIAMVGRITLQLNTSEELCKKQREENRANNDRSYRRGQDEARRKNRRTQDEEKTQKTYIKQIEMQLSQEEDANSDLRQRLKNLQELWDCTQPPTTPQRA